MSKLNILCGEKIMGWKLTDPGSPWPPGWNPEKCLEDALVCLERAAQGKGYSIYMFPEEKKPYDVELEVFKVCTDAKTLPLAMCICSLRAMGVPESEIQEASNERSKTE